MITLWQGDTLKTASVANSDWAWMDDLIKKNRPPREARAREALELACKAGVSERDIVAAQAKLGLPQFFAWYTLTDEQLAAYSAALRVLAGFY